MQYIRHLVERIGKKLETVFFAENKLLKTVPFNDLLTDPVHAVENAERFFLRIDVAGKKTDQSKEKDIKDDKIFDEEKLIGEIKGHRSLLSRRHQHEQKNIDDACQEKSEYKKRNKERPDRFIDEKLSFVFLFRNSIWGRFPMSCRRQQLLPGIHPLWKFLRRR